MELPAGIAQPDWAHTFRRFMAGVAEGNVAVAQDAVNALEARRQLRGLSRGEARLLSAARAVVSTST